MDIAKYPVDFRQIGVICDVFRPYGVYLMTLKKSNHLPDRAAWVLALLSLLVAPCHAQSTDDVDFFRTKVKPILQ